VRGTSLRCCLEKDAFFLIDNKERAPRAHLPLPAPPIQTLQRVPPGHILGPNVAGPGSANREVAMPSWYRSEKHCSSAGICHPTPTEGRDVASSRRTESQGGNDELQRKTPDIEKGSNIDPD
jgi:hypothetical protein